MPRKHIHKPGTDLRRNYPFENIEHALEAVIMEGYSIGQAAERWSVPKSTLWRKYRGMTSDKLGKPPALSVLEEKNIVQALTTAARFGYPFNREELKKFVQKYLIRKDVIIRCFTDNLPGDEWCKNFENRNPELTRRNCENMKRVKAQLSEEVVSNYFAELETSLAGISAENILNYDETNISDDPGRTKVFVKKGSKHASRIIDSSKSSNSVMFAVLGDGTLLPPYVVYRAKNIYPEWIENGPPGARYNRSKNGWFDSVIFEDWFTSIALPALRRKAGKKIVIGDNLSSHLSINIIRLCEENDIAFTFFPPNSTHVCQPLDVAVFGPLKKAWRKILTEWKCKNRGVISKTEFPSLLQKLLKSMEPTMSQNIRSGFESCGIIPINPDKVKSKLIGQQCNKNNTTDNDMLTQSFEQFMSAKTTINENKQPKRSRKVTIAAGKSIALGDLTAGPSHQNLRNHSDETDSNKENEPVNNCDNHIGAESDASIAAETDEETDQDSENQTDSDDGSHKKLQTEILKKPVTSFNELRENMFIIVGLVYNRNSKKECVKKFLAKIISIDKNIINVSFLRNYRGKKNMFIFPPVTDLSQVQISDINFIVSQPIVCRGIHTFSGDLI